MSVNSGSDSQGPPAAGRLSPDDHLQSDNEDSGADPVSNHQRDNDLFATDPLAEEPQQPSVHACPYQSPITDCSHRITFKPRHKRPSRFSLSNLFSSDSTPGSFLRNARSGSQQQPDAERSNTFPTRNQEPGPRGVDGTKDGGPLDWYVEGPGRRVGYDDLTAIDWIFEYTKERQRKRLLYSRGQGFLGHLLRLLDESHIWLVLVATGIAVGIIAAAIDIVSDWLGDLKTGYCKAGSGGGKFYLNKSFCCWGHEGRRSTHDVHISVES